MHTRIVAIFLAISFLIPVLPIEQNSDETEPEIAYFPHALATQTGYPNSDMSVLWIRRNGSDPGFDYGGANVSPQYGMNYFGTNKLQVTWGYSWADIADTSLFPSNCEIWVQIDYSATDAMYVADNAVNDSRIMGAFIDDFQVGWQSPANMSAIYTQLHWQDSNLSQGNLSLGIIVYNRNYFKQSPYTWNQVKPYFDTIHFWYAVFTYNLLYPGFAGYEDDFKILHSWMPEKEYWLGIYLHYYNAGSYPLNFTYEQMGIALSLIKSGYATHISILENFWIQHNTPTAQLVRDYVNNEYAKNYSTAWRFGTNTITSYLNITPLIDDIVTGVTFYDTYGLTGASYTLISNHFQVLKVQEGDTNYIIWNMRNGKWTFPYYFDEINSTGYYCLLPSEKYRITADYSLGYYVLEGDQYINAPDSWTNGIYIVNGNVTVNHTLYIINAIVRFGTDNYNNTMFNNTTPNFGFYIDDSDTASFVVRDSIIEGVSRAYPYHIQRPDSSNGYDFQSFIIARSVIACYSHDFRPYGTVTIWGSTFYQVQPVGATNNALLWMLVPSRIKNVSIINSIFWNYDVIGTIGVFAMPYDLPDTGKWQVVNTQIIGGQYGLWIDLTFSNELIEMWNLTMYESGYNNLFTTFRFSGGTDTGMVIWNHASLMNWSIKAEGTTDFVFVIIYDAIEKGVYTITKDEISTTRAITEIPFVYNASFETIWKAYRNNFTITLYQRLYASTETDISNLIWLLLFFIVPIALCQAIPKIGFIFGSALMLVVFALTDSTFIPYMIICFVGIGSYIYKGA